MRTWRNARRLVLGALLAVAVPVIWPNAAQGECLYAVAYVSRADADPIYVAGPEGCVTETPWNQVVFVPGGLTVTELPAGTPNGYHAEVRIPFP